MAWYNAAMDSGHAIGALGAALPTLFVRDAGRERGSRACADVHALRRRRRAVDDSLCAASTQVEPASAERRRASRWRQRRRSTHARDRPPDRRRCSRSTASAAAFSARRWSAYWFFERYGTSEVQLAWLFFAARVLNVVSHLAAAWLAKRIGLINTMVFTHLPSSVFMMLAPTAPSAAIAAAFFLAREALVEMDVPTRQSYVMAVVPPSARTYASGMTNVTRNAGWAVGPLDWRHRHAAPVAGRAAVHRRVAEDPLRHRAVSIVPAPEGAGGKGLNPFTPPAAT